jgi:hypothetical protein
VIRSQLSDIKNVVRDRVNPGGFRAAATYVLIVVAVFTVTVFTTTPSNVGLDWIPFILLSAPWCAIDQRLLLPGLLANTCLVYLFGVLFHGLCRRPD